jgi:hypothetical protein
VGFYSIYNFIVLLPTLTGKKLGGTRKIPLTCRSILTTAGIYKKHIKNDGASNNKMNGYFKKFTKVIKKYQAGN